MKRRALLIGIDSYALLGDLKYARRDAEAFGSTLQEWCGFDPGDVTLMSCQAEGGLRAYSSYIERALDGLRQERDLDLLIVGFWGHGFAPDRGKRYLCGVETSENDLKRTAVPLEVVRAKLTQAQARDTLIILDCCQNRPAGRSADAKPVSQGEEAAMDNMARDIKTGRRKDAPFAMPTVAVLSSCCEGEKAYEWDQHQHGIFTAHLLEGLRSGITSVAQLARYTSDRVVRTANELHHQRQTPYFTIAGTGDIVIATQAMASQVSPTPQPLSAPPSQPVISPKPPSRKKREGRCWAVVDGQEQGPLSEKKIIALIDDGKLTGQSQVCREGMSEWSAAENVDALRPLLLPVSPPRTDPVVEKKESPDLRRDITQDVQEYEQARDSGEDSAEFLRRSHLGRLHDWRQAADFGWPEGQFLVGRCLQEGVGLPEDKIAGCGMIRKAAGQGYAAAQNSLGKCYLDGEGVSEDKNEAVVWYRKAAEQGYAAAQFHLGFWYDAGSNGVSEDDAEAVEWFRKAAEQGHVEAQFSLGGCCDFSQGIYTAEAADWYRKAAEQGHADAQYSLAESYYSGGHGVSEDKAEAVKWCRKAAEQGDVNAQAWLGGCYYNGEGVSEDKAEAVEWFRKAAEQGDADAQWWLGWCYYNGEGVYVRNTAQAAMWYRKAAEQGHVEAQFRLGACYYHGQGLSENDAKAAKWFRKAAEQGHAEGQFFLGDCYHHGRGRSENKATAVEWYRKAAEQGQVQAQDELRMCGYDPAAVGSEYKTKVAELYRKATVQEDAASQYELGRCYYHGQGVSEDRVRAVAWFHVAAKQEDAQAQCYLGYCYDHGHGVTKDKAEAVKWFNKAAEQEHDAAKRALGRRRD